MARKRTTANQILLPPDLDRNRAAEDAAHEKACRDPDMIKAAGITNGMPAHEQRRRLLRAAGFIVSE